MHSKHSLQHAKRTFHDASNNVRREETGYFIMPQDRRTYSVKRKWCSREIICQISQVKLLFLR